MAFTIEKCKCWKNQKKTAGALTKQKALSFGLSKSTSFNFLLFFNVGLGADLGGLQVVMVKVCGHYGLLRSLNIKENEKVKNNDFWVVTSAT